MTDSPGPSAPPETPLLEASGIHYSYGAIKALHGVDISIYAGEGVCVIGPNGAGKTTLARVLGGVLRLQTGRVVIAGQPLPEKPHRVVLCGVASVLEGRRLFPDQSVQVNLQLGAYARRRGRTVAERLERVFDLFPALAARSGQRASTLSGGEQQMVAIGRALMAEPELLILDEPSMGLAPIVASEVFQAIGRLKATGLSVLLVEQNAALALELAERVYVLQQGSVVANGAVEELRDLDLVRTSYLGDDAKVSSSGNPDEQPPAAGQSEE